MTPERLAAFEAAAPGERVEFFRDPRTEEDELLFPGLFTPEVVAELKKPLTGLGATGFAGQHQQSPAPEDGNKFKRSNWRFWRPSGVAPDARFPRPKGCASADDFPAKPLPRLQAIIGSLDAAFKETKRSDFVVFTVWGVHFSERYLLDMVRGRMDFDKTRAALAGCGNRKCPGCWKCAASLVHRHPRCRRWLVEDKANGSAIVSSLKTVVPGIIEVNPEGGKEARASAVEPYHEAHQLYLPEGAPWLDGFVSEFASFPNGKNDDQVDSTSQLIVYLGSKQGKLRTMSLAEY